MAKTMKTIFMMLALLTAVQASAQTETLKVWMDDVTMTADGQTVTRLYVMENDVVDYTAFSLSLIVPKGVTIAKVKSGRITVNDIRLTERLNDHTISCNMLSDGRTIKIISSSLSNSNFYHDDVDGNVMDSIFSIGLVADPDMVHGNYSIEINDCKFVLQDATASQPLEAVTASMKVTGGVDGLAINYEMAEGWNWISTSIPADAVAFVEGLKTDFYRLVSQTQELYNDSKLGIVGSLEAIDVTAAYKLQTTTATTMTLQGIPENPTTTSLSLQKGYNWIGYLPMTALPVATALSQLEAAIGDRLISQNGFAEYGDDGWEGQLAMMNPTEGYIYHRTADATTFCYTEDAGGNAVETVSAAAVPKSDSMEPSWSYDVHAYPDVTTIIAQLYIMEQMADLDRYTVGAFCGEECRGIASVVGDKLFITVHGTVKDNETISFRVYDETKGESLSVSETIVFEGQSLGNLKSPMPLHAETVTTGISGVATMYDVRTIHSISGKRLGGLQRGVNIVTKTDGTTRKRVVK